MPNQPRADNPPGIVELRIEATPHDVGNDGEVYHWGRVTPAEAANTLRHYADQIAGWTAEDQHDRMRCGHCRGWEPRADA